MFSAIIPRMSVLVRHNNPFVHRLSSRSAVYLDKSLDVNTEEGQATHLHNAVAPLSNVYPSVETKVYQQRGSDPDTFGDLSSVPDVPPELAEGDEADRAEGTIYSREQDRERRRVHYSALITELLAEKKLAMALEVLETEMKSVKAKPDRKIFADLILFCGKVGYPQKAFKLFNQMKKRGYTASGGIYTSLFNACANCPVRDIALKYLQRLKDSMEAKGWKPNAITYNAMIKAYGRHGDIETAFHLADQIMRDRIPLDVKTMSFLLQSCISNKEAGFRISLQVWHKIRQYRIHPELYSYNLLLRCVRDSGLGDLESLNNVLKTLMPNEEPLQIGAKAGAETPVDVKDEAYPWDIAKREFVDGSTIQNEDERTDSNDSSPTSGVLSTTIPSVRPDLLSLKPTLGGLVIIEEIKTAADRLLLLGGSKGVLDSMLADNVKPDIKTFTLLLDCIPGTVTAEKNLMTEMKSSGVSPDAGFFNALIYRRARRRDFKEGFEVLEIMKENNVEIDNITVHSLAYCIVDVETFEKFLEDIKDAGYSPTTPMLGSVLKNALTTNNFGFIHRVMDAYTKNEVKVHKSTLTQVEEFHYRNSRILKGKDEPKNMISLYTSDYFKTGMKLFICKYSDWKRRIVFDDTSDADYHEQFKKTGNEMEELKPYIQKWKKGNRYARAEWRKKKQQAQTA